MYVPRYPTLWPEFLIRKRGDCFPYPLNQANALLYERCLAAISGGLRWLGLLRGEKALLPSYICRDVLIPFQRAGLEIDFFHVQLNLEPVRTDLEKRIRKGARVILAVHYFGFPQDVDYLVWLREKYGVYVIEDCAHAFLSEYGDTPLGSIGDISIFSLRKTVPLHYLGMLLTRGDSNGRIAACGTASIPAYRASLKSMARNVRFRLTHSAVNHEQEAGDPRLVSGQCVSSQLEMKSGRLPWIGKRLLEGLDYDAIRRRRTRNFQILLDGLSTNRKVTPLFMTLPEGSCPMALPVLVNERDKVHRLFESEGVDAYPWPFLPEGLGSEYETAHYLAKHILLLPIHQDLSVKDVRAIGSLISRITNENSLPTKLSEDRANNRVNSCDER